MIDLNELYIMRNFIEEIRRNKWVDVIRKKREADTSEIEAKALNLCSSHIQGLIDAAECGKT